MSCHMQEKFLPCKKSLQGSKASLKYSIILGESYIFLHKTKSPANAGNGGSKPPPYKYTYFLNKTKRVCSRKGTEVRIANFFKETLRVNTDPFFCENHVSSSVALKTKKSRFREELELSLFQLSIEKPNMATLTQGSKKNSPVNYFSPATSWKT